MQPAQKHTVSEGVGQVFKTSVAIWIILRVNTASVGDGTEVGLETVAPRGTESWFSSVQSLSRVWLFATPWTAACQASLSITNSWSLLNLMSIESVMPSNHLILCRPLLFLPSVFPIRVFPMSQLFASGGQNIGASASASVLSVHIQGWFPLGLTGMISLQSKGLSSSTIYYNYFLSRQIKIFSWSFNTKL